MSFNIKLGYTTANSKAVGKTYTEVTPTGGIPIAPTSTIDQLNPVFVIDYNANYLNINYCEASFLGRKYFAKCHYETGNRMTIECEVDYLSSFDLSKCQITALRNGGIGKPTKIQDNKLPVLTTEQEIEQTVAINDSITPHGTNCYVITVIGGEINASE